MYLNVHSEYSLRYGTMSVERLVELAVQNGVRQMALTDINNSSAVMKFMRECESQGIRPIGGIEFRKDKKFLYVGIAHNKEGMKQLNDFLTDHNLRQMDLPDQAPSLTNASFIYRFGYAGTLKANEYLGIRHEDLHRLHNRDLTELKERLVVLQPVVISDEESYIVHEHLRAIDLNTLITMVEGEDKCRITDVFMPVDELMAMFSNYPFIVENTAMLMSGCEMNFQLGKLNKQCFTNSKEDDFSLLRQLAYEGMEKRYGKGHQEATEKIEKELKVIRKQDFCAYFLITWDIIQFSSSRGFYHVGRGSGANSVVSYCLRITDVDPLALDLYFERFLNEQRSSPPDFDIDYSWDQREEVQQYIMKTYGKAHTALLGTMSTFKDRSVIRELGKVMGLPKSEIDSFTDPTKINVNRNNDTFRRITSLHQSMREMPNQRSIHAGGVLISEEPITYFTALDLPPKGLPTVQWDMYEAEKIGYDKYDILSQRGIGHIKEAVQIIEKNKGDVIDIHDVKRFMKDPSINDKLKRGDSIGCFYIESPAMRQLLCKLGCDNYLVLVAASSIIRPGVASSGMMPAYIRYHHHPEQVNYLHPVMEEQLKETYGVMVYQEDVIKVCMHFAGMDGADADTLRRGMSGKYRSKREFDNLMERFFVGAERLGRERKVVDEVWRQVSSFAGYSFSKAHSASFAVESYQSLFLKTYYPREFMVAVLNNYGGFYSRWLYVHELRKAGAVVHLPCVNHSEPVVCIDGDDAYLGFIGIQGLEGKFMELVPKERKSNGAYRDLEDFVKRTGIGLEQMVILIRVGALWFTGKSKKELLWDAHLLLGNKAKRSGVAELFKLQAKRYELPQFDSTQLEDAYHELELLDFPVSLSMFDLLKTKYRGDIQASALQGYVGKTVKMVGMYVCEKTVNTKNNKRMWFGTFLDVQGDFFDTTHFPNTTPVYPFRGKGCYLMLGKVVEDFGFPSLEVVKFAKLDIVGNPVMD